jgi:hypothetical protein
VVVVVVVAAVVLLLPALSSSSVLSLACDDSADDCSLDPFDDWLDALTWLDAPPSPLDTSCTILLSCEAFAVALREKRPRLPGPSSKDVDRPTFSSIWSMFCV